MESTRQLPVDLFLVLLATGLVNAVVFLPGLNGTPLRTVFGLMFVILIPGYALVSALFPEADQSVFREQSSDDYSEVATDRWDISGVERAALSLGLSVAVVPLIGLGLNFTPWGIQLVPIMIGVSAFTVAATVVAVRRRLALSPDERFQIWLFPYRAWVQKIQKPETRLGAFLNLTLLMGILLAAGSVGFVLATPSPADTTTGFYLMTENETGDLIAANYPEEMTVGEPETLVMGIENNEHERTEYTVIVQLQEVEQSEEGVRIVRRQEVDRFERVLARGETWRHPHRITPGTEGEGLRLQYLLYRGDVPDTATTETAYRSLHLWVDVEE